MKLGDTIHGARALATSTDARLGFWIFVAAWLAAVSLLLSLF